MRRSVLGLTAATIGFCAVALAQDAYQAIPKAWDHVDAATMDLPLAGLGSAPRHQSAAVYYKRPVYRLQRAYPVYAPGREPAGYMAWLRQQDPSILEVDPAALRTEEDWIKAGELLFNGARRVNEITVADLNSADFYKSTGSDRRRWECPRIPVFRS